MAMAVALPARDAPIPFTEASPPRRRALPQHSALGQTALPTSASEGTLVHSTPVAQPGQPSKIKPFILRSTSPASRGAPASPPPAGTSLNRAASVPAFGAKLRSTGPTPPLPSGKSTKARSSASRPRPPLRSAATTDDQRHSRRSSIVLVQTTSDQKRIEIKRSNGTSRRREGEGSSVEKGKRWFANLGGGGAAVDRERSAGPALQARRKASLGDMTNGLRRAPTPPVFEPASPPTTELSSSSASSATIMPSHRLPRSPTKRSSLHDLTTPPRQTSASAAPLRAPGGSAVADRARKDRYAALSRAQTRPGRGEEAYSSMQEMLESSGFADVRVVTPTSTIRVAPTHASAVPIAGLALPAAKPHPLATQSTSLASSVTFSDTNAFGSPSSLAPPLSLAHKTSMLSLRGLFSLWKADAAIAGEIAAAPGGDAEEETLSETGSDDTITLERKRQFVAHTQQWVDHVSREVATLSAPTHTLLHQSSSPHLSSYPPRPPTPRKSSAPDPELNDHTVLRDPSPRRAGQRALKTLRHVVSDPELAPTHSTTVEDRDDIVSESGYQSFALGGLALAFGGEAGFPGAGDDEIRREYDDVSSEDERSSTGRRRSRVPPPPSALPTNQRSTLAPPSAHQHTLKPQTSFWNTLKNKASEALMGQYGAQPSRAGGNDSDDEEPDWEQVVRPKKSTRALPSSLARGIRAS